jgi:predicted TIM-barrel fold metal-dependent hydrolase
VTPPIAQLHVPAGAVDAHAHVMRREAKLIAERHSEPQRDVSADDYIALLDSVAIRYGVLTAPSFLGPDNRLLLAALDNCPERLRGTVIVNPDVDDDTLADMDRRGVVGIRLNWIRSASLPDIDSASYTRLFAAVRRLKWHVEVFQEDAPLAAVLPRLLDHGVPVVLDHFGAPDPDKGVDGPGFCAVLRAVAQRVAWVKLSAPYRLGGADPRRYVDALLDAGGPDQLVWGSDFPWVQHENWRAGIDYGRSVDWLADWVPDEAVQHTIMATTPRRLFRFDTHCV